MCERQNKTVMHMAWQALNKEKCRLFGQGRSDRVAGRLDRLPHSAYKNIHQTNYASQTITNVT
jgi:hypothetical protein